MVLDLRPGAMEADSNVGGRRRHRGQEAACQPILDRRSYSSGRRPAPKTDGGAAQGQEGRIGTKLNEPFESAFLHEGGGGQDGPDGLKG